MHEASGQYWLCGTYIQTFSRPLLWKWHMPASHYFSWLLVNTWTCVLECFFLIWPFDVCNFGSFTSVINSLSKSSYSYSILGGWGVLLAFLKSRKHKVMNIIKQKHYFFSTWSHYHAGNIKHGIRKQNASPLLTPKTYGSWALALRSRNIV